MEIERKAFKVISNLGRAPFDTLLDACRGGCCPCPDSVQAHLACKSIHLSDDAVEAYTQAVSSSRSSETILEWALRVCPTNKFICVNLPGVHKPRTVHTSIADVLKSGVINWMDTTKQALSTETKEQAHSELSLAIEPPNIKFSDIALQAMKGIADKLCKNPEPPEAKAKPVFPSEIVLYDAMYVAQKHGVHKAAVNSLAKMVCAKIQVLTHFEIPLAGEKTVGHDEARLQTKKGDTTVFLSDKAPGDKTYAIMVKTDPRSGDAAHASYITKKNYNGSFAIASQVKYKNS